MSMQVARDEEAPVKRKTAARAVAIDDEDEAPESMEPYYVPAAMRPGFLLLPEFSRPGGIRFEKVHGDGASRRVIKDSPKLERMSRKIINTAYSKLIEHYTHVPWGFFCEEHQIEEARALLAECQKGAYFTNDYAREHGSDRRVRIDLFATRWDHNDEHWRSRLGEMIAKKLMEIRQVYTTKDMGAFRIQIDRVHHMEKIVIGEQHKLVADALNATIQQRKIMVAIYGDKVPRDWLDPRTGQLKAGIKLDFGPIDKAIKYFCPSWKPSDE